MLLLLMLLLLSCCCMCLRLLFRCRQYIGKLLLSVARTTASRRECALHSLSSIEQCSAARMAPPRPLSLFQVACASSACCLLASFLFAPLLCDIAISQSVDVHHTSHDRKKSNRTQESGRVGRKHHKDADMRLIS